MPCIELVTPDSFCIFPRDCFKPEFSVKVFEYAFVKIRLVLCGIHNGVEKGHKGRKQEHKKKRYHLATSICGDPDSTFSLPPAAHPPTHKNINAAIMTINHLVALSLAVSTFLYAALTPYIKNASNKMSVIQKTGFKKSPFERKKKATCGPTITIIQLITVQLTNDLSLFLPILI